MKSSAEYAASLRDGRRVYIDGQRVADVTTHDRLAAAVAWVGEGYDRVLASGHEVHPLFRPSRSKDDLRERVRMTVEDTAGTDLTVSTTSSSLFALLTARADLAQQDSAYGDRIDRYFAYVRDNDLRVAEGITDSKGMRTRKPLEQDDPGQYVRVVDRTPDGVILEGAKLHVSGAPIVHEILVMPTKRFGPGEEDYAIACAIPVDTEGVHVLSASYAPHGGDARDYPVSSRHSMPEGFVVLDRVFVPNERIFLDGEVAVSARIVHALGLWERLGGLTHLSMNGDELLGLGLLAAEANGVQRVPHVKEKLSEIAIYTTILRGMLEAAIESCGSTADGLVYPGDLMTNAGKYYGASNYSSMVARLHDIAGGIVVTAPSMAQFDDPATAGYMERFVGTSDAVSGQYRAALMHAIRDVSADALGGWRNVTKLMSGGGMMAQRLVTMKHYDLKGARERALAMFAHVLEDLEQPVTESSNRVSDVMTRSSRG